MADLRQRGIITKVRSLKTGQTIGGIAFTRGPLAHLLRNRFYIGEVDFKGEVIPGQQPAILDRDLFDAVQAKLNDHRTNHVAARAKSESLLIGRIYDDRGSRMSPSHARKHGIRYRYYVSSPLLHGQAERVGSVRRVPAAEIEALVGHAVHEHLEDSTQTNDRDLISTHVVRVIVRADQLAVELKAPKQRQTRGRATGAPPEHESSEQDTDRTVLHIPWRKYRRNGGARSSCQNPLRLRIPAPSAPRPAPSLSRQSPVAGAGSMKSPRAP
jgi:site-specific DNA recombinase